jgi:hypothetical protein
MRFVLEIDMEDGAGMYDISGVLRSVADIIYEADITKLSGSEFQKETNILDVNGNVVGFYKVVES